MQRIFAWFFLFASVAAASAAVPPVTPYTVIAKVTSFEHYRAFGGAQAYSLATPHGNGSTIVATILAPASLAGREIAIPFESRRDNQELLVQKGTIFRFDHVRNLADLRNRTDWVRRRAIAFPEKGILVLGPDGEVAETYDGALRPAK